MLDGFLLPSVQIDPSSKKVSFCLRSDYNGIVSRVLDQFNHSSLRHRGIRGAADEPVLNNALNSGLHTWIVVLHTGFPFTLKKPL
jgi:hypothetical protein